MSPTKKARPTKLRHAIHAGSHPERTAGDENIQPQHGAIGPSITIAGRRVGCGAPTLVIAEAGVCHNGCVETALEMIDVAADAGADAVKFQIFRARDLVTESAPTAKYQRKQSGPKSQRELLEPLELSSADFAKIARRCKKRSILFLATPFGTNDVDRLTKLDVGAIKIASTDLTNDELVDKAIETELPLILSTGAATRDEIHQTIDRLLSADLENRLVVLHCVSCYPTPVESINLGAIRTLGESFDLVTGLSDHTTSVYMGGLAVAAGASVVEKHFTLDRKAAGPDHAMALNPKQLAEYISIVREADEATTPAEIGMTEIEDEVRSIARKSVVATREISAGSVLDATMFAIKRPGTGIAPAQLPELFNRKARVDIPADTLLAWEMVE